MPTAKRRAPSSNRTTQSQLATIAELQRALRAAEAKIAQLTRRLERNQTIIENRRFARGVAAPVIKGPSALTVREREVLWAYLEHCNDPKVAAHFGTSVQTVRNQMHSILVKLGVETRAELVIGVFNGRLPKQGRKKQAGKTRKLSSR